MHSFAQEASKPRPSSVREIQLPRRQKYYESPVTWLDEILYFLLPDRFSDGREAERPLLDFANPASARDQSFRFDEWSRSGGDRWQGGTLKGITSKMDYLAGLGITALWVGPVFKQRTHLDTYHGYAIQDFLEVDTRLGTRQDLVDLVSAAHDRGIRVILDIIFNHSGCNWLYRGGERTPPYLPPPGKYELGPWFDGSGQLTENVPQDGQDTGVWPLELQNPICYTRAGTGNLGAGDLSDPEAECRRTDFMELRDFEHHREVLSDLCRCFQYWIALTDCDGFRIDTLKHVSDEAARNFCGAIKEFALNLGKSDFFLVGEIAGSAMDAEYIRRIVGHNLNASLDIGENRVALTGVAKGLVDPHAYFIPVNAWDKDLGSHRNAGKRHVLILDDHDHVSGVKSRFSADAASSRQIAAGTFIQLFSLGIPCIYYGSEQSFAGPEPNLRQQFLPDFGTNDKYLREAMFGPRHPRKQGNAGLRSGPEGEDTALPGFGPFGTTGHHCFDPQSPVYRRISAMTTLRKAYPVLRHGRQYQREVSVFGFSFVLPKAGELVAWSRILNDEEALCVFNGHGLESRGGKVVVDANLNARAGAQFEIVLISEDAETAGTASPVKREPLPVQWYGGTAYVEILDLKPSETLILVNRR